MLWKNIYRSVSFGVGLWPTTFVRYVLMVNYLLGDNAFDVVLLHHSVEKAHEEVLVVAIEENLVNLRRGVSFLAERLQKVVVAPSL